MADEEDTQTEDAGVPADYTLRVPSGAQIEPGVQPRWKEVFRAGNLSQEQVDHVLAWHELLVQQVAHTRAAEALGTQGTGGQSLAGGSEEAGLKSRQRELLTKQLGAEGLTAAESAELRESYARRVQLRPPR